MVSKKSLSILFLIFSTLFLKSQESKFRLGVGLKPIKSSVESDPYLNLQEFYAISPCIVIDYKLTNKFSISSGIEYEKKGGEGDLTATILGGQLIDVLTTFQLHFLQVPIMVTYKTNGKVKFLGNLGVNVGYLFDQSISTKNNIQPKLETDFSEFELSLLLGAGLEIDCGEKFDLGLGIRNNIGLTELKSAGGNLDLKTNTIGLLLNLSYNL